MGCWISDDSRLELSCIHPSGKMPCACSDQVWNEGETRRPAAIVRLSSIHSDGGRELLDEAVRALRYVSMALATRGLLVMAARSLMVRREEEMCCRRPGVAKGWGMVFRHTASRTHAVQ